MSTISQYETHAGDGDQKNSAGQEPKENFVGVKDDTHHLNQPRDEYSLGNRAKAEKKLEKEEKKAEEEAADKLPTQAARDHGNEPSKGAKIDEQIMLEEQAELERKGKA